MMMRSNHRRVLRPLLCFAALLAAAPLAWAQQEGEPAADAAPATVEVKPVRTEQAPPAPADDGETKRLEDVIVTSTKREKSVREIPATINALHGEELEKQGAREMRDYLNLVPGVTLQDSSDGDFDNTRKISIRGIVPGDTANQTTGILFGDVTLTDPYQTYVLPDIDPFDLSTVEVLKGPQGTTFGASALNGAIRFVPNAPNPGQFEGKAFVEGRQTNESETSGWVGGLALNAPLGDTAALRLAGIKQYTPGLYDVVNQRYNKVDADSVERWAGRIMARWEPGEHWQVNALHMVQHRTSDGLSSANNEDGEFENTGQSPTALKSNFSVSNLDLRYDLGWASFVSQTSHSTKTRDSDSDTPTATPPLPQGLLVLRTFAHADISSYSQELRLVSAESADSRWIWLGGLYYSWYQAKLQLVQGYASDAQSAGTLTRLIPIANALVSPRGPALAWGELGPDPLQAVEKAAFGELTRKLGQRWQMTLGGRYYNTDLSSDVTLKGLLIPVIFPGSTTYTNHYRVTDKGFSPKAAITYQHSRDLLFYANAARGIQYGGVNLYQSTDPRYETPADYEASSLWSYELGGRSDWLDRTLRLDLTAFFIDWTQPQILQDAPGPTNLYTYVDNVGASTSKGVEASFRWLPPWPAGTSLSVAAAYIIAKTSVPYTDAAGTTVPAGSDMPQTPKAQAAATLGYSRSLGPWLLSPNLVYSYQGRAWNNILQQHEIYGYDTWSVNLAVSRPDWRFAPELAFAINNLTDERAFTYYKSGALVALSGYESLTTRTTTAYTRPRSMSLRLSMSF